MPDTDLHVRTPFRGSSLSSPKLWRAEGNNAANQMLISPMIGYHFADGWALSSSPKIIANWIANGNKWTVGGSVSKVGEQPIGSGLPPALSSCTVIRYRFETFLSLALKLDALSAHYVLFLKPAFEYFPRILSRKIVPKFDNPRDLEVCEPF